MKVQNLIKGLCNTGNSKQLYEKAELQFSANTYFAELQFSANSDVVKIAQRRHEKMSWQVYMTPKI